MLQRLFIQNYAIIEEIEIEFTKGLVVITGETGAGKSILMGALGLILGERAETGVLVNKEKKLTILLVEQKLPFARRVAQNFCILDKGRSVAADEMENLGEEIINQHLKV